MRLLDCFLHSLSGYGNRLKDVVPSKGFQVGVEDGLVSLFFEESRRGKEKKLGLREKASSESQYQQQSQ